MVSNRQAQHSWVLGRDDNFALGGAEAASVRLQKCLLDGQIASEIFSPDISDVGFGWDVFL